MDSESRPGSGSKPWHWLAALVTPMRDSAQGRPRPARGKGGCPCSGPPPPTAVEDYEGRPLRSGPLPSRAAWAGRNSPPPVPPTSVDSEGGGFLPQHYGAGPAHAATPVDRDGGPSNTHLVD